MRGGARKAASAAEHAPRGLAARHATDCVSSPLCGLFLCPVGALAGVLRRDDVVRRLGLRAAISFCKLSTCARTCVSICSSLAISAAVARSDFLVPAIHFLTRLSSVEISQARPDFLTLRKRPSLIASLTAAAVMPHFSAISSHFSHSIDTPNVSTCACLAQLLTV